MKTILRLGTVGAVGVAALAFAGNALATQRLSVTQSATSLTIKVTQDATDQQPSKIQIYVPAGYTLNTSAAPGQTIGTTTGVVIARDQGNIDLPLTGDVLVADPKQHATDACSPGAQAVWILQLSVAGQTISLPVYINPTTGAETGLGSAKLSVCLAPSDTPQGSPGRSPFGAQLKSATFTVNNVFTPPAGAVRWESLWTPWGAGNGVPNVAGTVEARAFAGPGAITISGRVTNKKKRIVRLQGKVTAAGVGIAGTTVSLLLNGKARYKKTTSGSGAYSFLLQKKKGSKVTTTFFQTKVAVPERDVTATGCASPAVPPIPCVSATQGSFTATSRKVRIRI
ncbi:MAG: hypothetical protein E6G50_04425 [Actinobacteria bacterium]|nr:MAG: hypothetical protein E6G50_04425 [Actinomycetota bacterium]